MSFEIDDVSVPRSEYIQSLSSGRRTSAFPTITKLLTSFMHGPSHPVYASLYFGHGLMLTPRVQIRDFPQFLNELAQCLRPGGVLVIGDGELQLYDEDRRAIAYSQPQSSSTQRLFFATYNAMKNRGGSVDSPYMSPTWLRGVESLTDVGWQKEFIPIGPWIYGKGLATNIVRRPKLKLATNTGSEGERLLAEMLRRNTLGFISGMGPLLLRYGNPSRARHAA